MAKKIEWIDEHSNPTQAMAQLRGLIENLYAEIERQNKYNQAQDEDIASARTDAARAASDALHIRNAISQPPGFQPGSRR